MPIKSSSGPCQVYDVHTYNGDLSREVARSERFLRGQLTNLKKSAWATLYGAENEANPDTAYVVRQKIDKLFKPEPPLVQLVEAKDTFGEDDFPRSSHAGVGKAGEAQQLADLKKLSRDDLIEELINVFSQRHPEEAANIEGYRDQLRDRLKTLRKEELIALVQQELGLGGRDFVVAPGASESFIPGQAPPQHIVQNRVPTPEEIAGWSREQRLAYALRNPRDYLDFLNSNYRSRSSAPDYLSTPNVLPYSVPSTPSSQSSYPSYQSYPSTPSPNLMTPTSYHSGQYYPSTPYGGLTPNNSEASLDYNLYLPQEPEGGVPPLTEAEQQTLAQIDASVAARNRQVTETQANSLGQALTEAQRQAQLEQSRQETEALGQAMIAQSQRNLEEAQIEANKQESANQGSAAAQSAQANLAQAVDQANYASALVEAYKRVESEQVQVQAQPQSAPNAPSAEALAAHAESLRKAMEEFNQPSQSLPLAPLPGQSLAIESGQPLPALPFRPAISAEPIEGKYEENAQGKVVAVPGYTPAPFVPKDYSQYDRNQLKQICKARNYNATDFQNQNGTDYRTWDKIPIDQLRDELDSDDRRRYNRQIRAELDAYLGQSQSLLTVPGTTGPARRSTTIDPYADYAHYFIPSSRAQASQSQSQSSQSAQGLTIKRIYQPKGKKSASHRAQILSGEIGAGNNAPSILRKLSSLRKGRHVRFV